MRNHRHIVVLSSLLAVLLPGAVIATPAMHAPAQIVLAQNDGPSLSEAVAMVQRRYRGGRIVSAETRMRGNREVHYIKVLTEDGKVKTERINGRTRGDRG